MGTDPYFFLWQYLNARPEMQQIMRDMLAIMMSPEVDRDERAAARLTLNEAMLVPREMIAAGQRASDKERK